MAASEIAPSETAAWKRSSTRTLADWLIATPLWVAQALRASCAKRLRLGGAAPRDLETRPALAVRHCDRRHAVGDHIDLLGELGIRRRDLGEKIVDRRLDAVARGLARDRDRIGCEKFLDECGALLTQRLSVPAHQHLRTEHRVILGERIPSLDLDRGA